jgi:transcriptional regulator GlxA family with amidase domain
VEIIAQEIDGAGLRALERLFADETGLTPAAWQRHSRKLMSLSVRAEGKSISEVAMRGHRHSALRSSNVSGSRLRPTVKVACGLRVGYVPIGAVFSA